MVARVVKDPGLVVIIVLSFNKKSVTLRCLKSIQGIEYSPFEVIVVDNGSTDGSPDAIAQAFPNYHLLRNATNLGPSGGRNIGMVFTNKHFSADYVFFLDNDTELDTKILSYLTESIRRKPTAGITCPKAYQEFPSSTLTSVGIYVNFYTGTIYDIGCGEVDKGQYDKEVSVPACASRGMLVKQEVLSKIGEWDNQFNPYGWEDVDICLRAAKLGYETIYVPKALLYHSGGKVGRGVVLSYEEYKIKHFFLLLRKHGSLIQYGCCLIWAPIRGILLVAKNIREGNLKTVQAQVKGFLKFFFK